MKHKTYKIKYGRNDWRVYTWSDHYGCYYESPSMSYSAACEAVRRDNAKGAD